MKEGNTLLALPHNQHLKQVKILWDLEGPCEFFRYVTNSIYLGTRSQQKCVIRLTHPRSRNLEQLNSEFSFMEEVSVAGIRTVLPFRNQKGNWVEQVSCEKGNLFYVSVFPFASGAPPTREEMETKQILMEWGQTIAKLHQVGQKYQAPQGTLERPEWNQETVLLTAQASTQADTSDRDSLAQCVTSLHRKFEKGVSRLEYGTIHADLHPGNFFVDQGKLVLFDFDDSCRHWYGYDLAVSATSLMQARRGLNLDDSAPKACSDLLEGYRFGRGNFCPDLPTLFYFIRYRLMLIRLWWKGRMEQGYGTKELESWGLEYDVWSRAREPKGEAF